MYTLDLYRKYRNIDKNKIDYFIRYHITNVSGVLTEACEKNETNQNNLFIFYQYLIIKLTNYGDSLKSYKEYQDIMKFFEIDTVEEKDYITIRDQFKDDSLNDKVEAYFNSAFDFYFSFCKNNNFNKYSNSLLDLSMLTIIKYNNDTDDITFDLDHTMDIMLDKKKEIIGDYDTNRFVIHDELDFNHFKDNIYNLLKKYELVFLQMDAKYNIDYTQSKYNGRLDLPINFVFKSGNDAYNIDFYLTLTYESELNMADIESLVDNLFQEIGKKYSYFNLDAIDFNNEKYRVKYVVNPSLIIHAKYENQNKDGIDRLGIYFDGSCKVKLPDCVSVTFFFTELMNAYNFNEDFDEVENVDDDTVKFYMDKGYEFIFDLKDKKKIEEAFNLYDKIKDYLDL